MGYSCTKDASDMLGLIRHSFNDGSTSNGMKIGSRTYFYEIGQEHADGHITGTLFENTGEGTARSAGSFSIAADGKINRFPRIKQNQKVSLFFRFLALKRTNPSKLSAFSFAAI